MFFKCLLKKKKKNIWFQTFHKCVSGNQNVVLGPFYLLKFKRCVWAPAKSSTEVCGRIPYTVTWLHSQKTKQYFPLLIYSLHRVVDVLFYLALDNLWFPVKSGNITLAINLDLFMYSDFIWHSTQLCLLSWNNNILCFSHLSSLSYLEINPNCPILS